MCDVIVTYRNVYSGGKKIVGPCKNGDWRDGYCFVHHPDNKKPAKPTPQERIAELEATRVPDDLLEWLIAKAHYAGAWGEKYDQAEEIMAKRKGGIK